MYPDSQYRRSEQREGGRGTGECLSRVCRVLQDEIGRQDDTDDDGPRGEHQPKKVAASGWIGSALEYHDFFIHATAASPVPKHEYDRMRTEALVAGKVLVS